MKIEMFELNIDNILFFHNFILMVLLLVHDLLLNITNGSIIFWFYTKIITIINNMIMIKTVFVITIYHMKVHYYCIALPVSFSQ